MSFPTPASWSALAVLLPLLAAVAACFVPTRRAAWWLAVAGSAAALGCTLGLVLSPAPPGLPTPFALLTAFVAAAGAWRGRDLARPQLALALALLAALLAALFADGVGLTWLAMEAALIAAAALLGLTHDDATAAAAGWRLLVAGGVGLGLALLGSVLLYLAARPALGPGMAGLSWTALARAAPALDGRLLSVAFALLLAGYGTLAALVPLHTWLPAAEAALPPPLAGLLGGAMTNAALVSILRARAVLAASSAAIPPGPALMALGLASLLLAAFALWRQREASRALAFAFIGQTGVATFAFGLGGPGGSFAGLLHLMLLTLAKAASALSLGDGPARRRTLAAGLVALAGLPPFGLLASLFLIAEATARRLPWLLAPLGLGVAVAAWALAARVAAPPAAEPGRAPAPEWLALLPAWLMLGLTVLLGLAMPGPVVAWFAAAAGAPR